MKFFTIPPMILMLIFFFPLAASFADNSGPSHFREITYTPKDLQELPLASPNQGALVESKVDELINLLESHKKAAIEGGNIEELQKTVQEINALIETRKSAPAKLSFVHFHESICFRCHARDDFSPTDKTRKEWRYFIENDGHGIFAPIPWESPSQKKQILEFLLDHAGNNRAEGIGVWN